VIEVVFSLACVTAPTAAPPVTAAPGTAPDASAPHDVDDGARKPAVDALIVDASTADLVALEAALGLRLDIRISRSDRARKPRAGERFAYLEVAPEAGNRVTVRLTLADARAWVRAIDAPAVDRTREIATTVANLIAGIEVDAIAPDLRDVPLPPPLRTLAPAPVAPAPVAAAPSAPPPPSLHWGFAVDGGVLVGVGPPAPTAIAGGTIAVRSGIRWRRGALFGAGLRAAFDRSAGSSMTRLRLDVGGGHAWHRRAFALHTTAAATLEPWFVTREGAIEAGAPRPVGLLAGGELRVAPMWRRTVGARTLVLGPFIALAGSGLVTGDGGVARIRAAGEGRVVDRFRAGGLELGAGMSIGLWSPRRR
jgi:hypothetical protein